MCSLVVLSKQFGLSIEKGEFPHDFNLPENQNYVGPLPEEKYYGTRFMTDKRYTEFKKWYDEERVSISEGVKPDWNFQTEILKYCENDVDVLMQA